MFAYCPAAGVPSAQDDGAEAGQHLRDEGAQEGVRSVDPFTLALYKSICDTLRVYDALCLGLVYLCVMTRFVVVE